METAIASLVQCSRSFGHARPAHVKTGPTLSGETGPTTHLCSPEAILVRRVNR